jgi:hypothetical protein
MFIQAPGMPMLSDPGWVFGERHAVYQMDASRECQKCQECATSLGTEADLTARAHLAGRDLRIARRVISICYINARRPEEKS